MPKLKRQGREWRGPCPIHNGKRDSFAVNPETGQWMCHSECGRGGDMIALEAALTGVSREAAREEIERMTGPSSGSRLQVDAYSYTDAKGVELFQVVRFEPKQFAQRHRGADGAWVWNRGGAPAVLYRLDRLTAADPDTRVFIVEGERDVHTLERWGLLATTNAGGAGKWPRETSVLAGRRVTIVPDRDEPGRRHARQVAAMLAGIAAEVHIVEVPRGKDVTEFAALGGTKEEFETVLSGTPRRDSANTARRVDDALWPAPLSESAYHGIAGAIARAIEPHTEADPAAILVQFLVGFGNLIGRSAHFIAEADRHYTNLFAVLVGETAKGRKGSSWGQILRLLMEVDPLWARERIMGGCGSGEGLIWAVRDDPAAPPLMYSEKRMLIQEPEFARLLQVCERDTNTLSAVLRQAWDSGNLRVMTKQQPAVATDAHISLIGHITSDELRKRLTGNAAANGFANRFLWVCVRRSKLLPFGGQWRLDAKLAEELRETVSWARLQGALERDDAANALWASEYERLSEGGVGLFGAVTSRAEAQTMRLATIYALLDRAPCIGEPHLHAALAVWRYAEQSAFYAFGGGTGDALADRLLRMLGCSPHGLTRSQIRDGLARGKSSREIEASLRYLETLGLASREGIETGTRPAELWRAA